MTIILSVAAGLIFLVLMYVYVSKFYRRYDKKIDNTVHRYGYKSLRQMERAGRKRQAFQKKYLGEESGVRKRPEPKKPSKHVSRKPSASKRGKPQKKRVKPAASRRKPAVRPAAARKRAPQGKGRGNKSRSSSASRRPTKRR